MTSQLSVGSVNSPLTPFCRSVSRRFWFLWQAGLEGDRPPGRHWFMLVEDPSPLADELV
jgi:hypothetical protein